MHVEGMGTIAGPPARGRTVSNVGCAEASKENAAVIRVVEICMIDEESGWSVCLPRALRLICRGVYYRKLRIPALEWVRYDTAEHMRPI